MLSLTSIQPIHADSHWLLIRATDAYESGEFAICKYLATKVRIQEPKCIEAYQLSYATEVELGNFNKAIQIIAAALKHFPQNNRLHEIKAILELAIEEKELCVG